MTRGGKALWTTPINFRGTEEMRLWLKEKAKEQQVPYSTLLRLMVVRAMGEDELTITQQLTPRAKEILKDRTYIKAKNLARLLGLEGISGTVTAGKILSSLPEWKPDRCQSVKRTWINSKLEMVA